MKIHKLYPVIVSILGEGTMPEEKHKILWLVIGATAFLLLVILASGNLLRITQPGVVGLIRINGMILDDRKIIAQLHWFANNPKVKAIVINFNTPGGTLSSAQSVSGQTRGGFFGRSLCFVRILHCLRHRPDFCQSSQHYRIHRSHCKPGDWTIAGKTKFEHGNSEKRGS
jgi:hypothetical protein